MERFSARAVTGGTGVNGLKMIFITADVLSSPHVDSILDCEKFELSRFPLSLQCSSIFTGLNG